MWFMPTRKTQALQVAHAFEKFLQTYNNFRCDHGLPGGIDNPHEILTSMSDKHGRICRQIKHFERHDEKSDWPIGLIEALTGYIVYATMLLNKYGLTIRRGMINELEASTNQHAHAK